METIENLNGREVPYPCTEEMIGDGYFAVECGSCGWIGCSCQTKGCIAIADTGDFSAMLCPECMSDKIEDLE